MKSLLGKRTGNPEDPVDRITDCHARIRNFAATAQRLLDEDASAEERAAAAGAVAHYFSTSFALHGRDEDEFLEPALRGRGDAALQQALDRLAPEHRLLDALLAELLPAWNDVARDGTRLDYHRGGIDGPTRAFVKLVEEHLGLEERDILPQAAQLLSSDEKRAIVSAMIALRQQGR